MCEWLMPGIPRTIAEDPDMGTVQRIQESITMDTGQVVESDLLEPCPFCGGKPYIQVYERSVTCIEARVICRSCHVSTTREYQSWMVTYGGVDLTRTLAIGRAISSWNRRAERTCRMVDNGCELCCSECDGRCEYDDEPNYCPNCGARVVR